MSNKNLAFSFKLTTNKIYTFLSATIEIDFAILYVLLTCGKLSLDFSNMFYVSLLKSWHFSLN